MTPDELKADAEKAQKNAEEHYKLHLQWLGIAQYLAGKLQEAKKPDGNPTNTP